MAFRRLFHSFPGVRLMVWEITRMTILKSLIKCRVEKCYQLPAKCVLWVEQDRVCLGKKKRRGLEWSRNLSHAWIREGKSSR